MTDYCLILEPIPIVAHDLATTAREDLGLETLIAATTDEACRKLSALPQESAVRLAFVHHAPDAFARDPLRRILEAQDAQVVLIGSGTESSAPESLWPALVWPFSTDNVRALIHRLGAPARPEPG